MVDSNYIPLTAANLLKIFSFSALLYIVGCAPPDTQQNIPGAEQLPNGELLNNLIDGAQELSIELQEVAKPNQVEAWVDQLIVKAQPGVKMPEVAKMREGEIATYLKQRTIRRSEFKLRGQRYYEPWILIRTKDSIMGWVHQGGVKFVEPDLVDLLKGNKPANNVQTRNLNPQARAIPEPIDYSFIPGKKAGFIDLGTTEEGLIKEFGPNQVRRGTISTSSVNVEFCTILFPDSPDEVNITWKTEDRKKVKAIYFDKYLSNWKMNNGLKVGMSLLDLCKVNEAPLNFYGFNWEYGGTIESWQNGKMAAYQRNFYAVLNPRSGKFTGEQSRRFAGDKVFTSNTEGVDQLDLVVSRIVIYLD